VDYPANSNTPDILNTRDRLGRPTTTAQGTLVGITTNTLAVNDGTGISLTAIRFTQYGFNPTKFTLDTEATNLGGGFPQKTLTRHYDDFARPRSLALGTDYTTAYGYDTTGRLGQVWDRPTLTPAGEPGGSPAFTYGYLSASSLIQTVTKAAGGTGIPALVATRIWDSTRDVLQKIENAAGPTIRSAYDYSTVNGGINSIGQRKGVQATFDLGTGVAGNTGPTSWNYDDLGQITSAATPVADHNRAYQYDAIGNRLKTSTGGAPLPPADNWMPNALNQYQTVPFTPSVPGYDNDGNMTSGPVPGANGNTPGVQPPANATVIAWDAENRLVSATVGGTTYHYEYDHHSRLISR
jgi:YD repeat-containing protein